MNMIQAKYINTQIIHACGMNVEGELQKKIDEWIFRHPEDFVVDIKVWSDTACHFYALILYKT